MPITQGLAISYKAEILRGIHTDTDTYKIALYTSAADIGPQTTVYTATGEVVGQGYTAGGMTLTGFAVTIDGSEGVLDFTNNPVWANATLTVRGAMIYNASKGNKVVGVFNYGTDKSCSDGDFTVNINALGVLRIN
jgi:hypothetical protein